MEPWLKIDRQSTHGDQIDLLISSLAESFAGRVRNDAAMKSPNGGDASEFWAKEYYRQQAESRKQQTWSSFLRPSAVAAFIAIAGRIVIGPLALLLLFTATRYLSDATVLIQADQSIFAFTERDSSMAGGCTGCLGPCKIVMLKYTLLKGVAVASAPPYFTFTSIAPSVSLYDFSPLSDEVLAFADSLDANGTYCQSSFNEWGTVPIVVTGTAQELLNTVRVAELNLSPQMVRELEFGIEHAKDCVSKWTMMSVVRLFQYPTVAGSSDFGHIPAVDTHVFPDYTECRPDIELNDELVGSKLALDTNGRDLLAVVPDELTLFPYSFTSSLPSISRISKADKTKTQNGAATVVQSALRGYYGGCRVRAVNTTGVYIEDTCEISKHWQTYGLMVHSPDDIPLCSTGDVCVHNFFNSLWEWEYYITADNPNRIGMNLNTFRSRYADTVAISVGVVVMQILLMGVISLYQVMASKRSVLLTQVWAYCCQNGRMQVVYLAQISYLGCPPMLIHSTLTQVVWLRRCLIPVVHDVLLRLFFGDLIVGSRLYFLKSRNSTVQQCVRGSCVFIETLEHCFLTCPALSEMWRKLWMPWRKAFAKDLNWKLLLFPKLRDIRNDWRQQHETLLLLWRVHTAVVFHATWRLRNDIYFQETQAEQPNVEGLMSSFRRHCQYIYEHYRIEHRQ